MYLIPVVIVLCLSSGFADEHNASVTTNKILITTNTETPVITTLRSLITTEMPVPTGGLITTTRKSNETTATTTTIGTPITTIGTSITTIGTPITTIRTPVTTIRTLITTIGTPSTTIGTRNATIGAPIITTEMPITTTGTPIGCVCGIFLSGQFKKGSKEPPTGNAALIHDQTDTFPCTPAGNRACTSKCLDTIIKYLPNSPTILCGSIDRDCYKERAYLFIKNCKSRWINTNLSAGREYCCKDGASYKCPI